MVIADSSVWITFQRQPSSEVARHLDSLLANHEIVMVGPVMTELLQGARSEEEFTFFAERLRVLSFLSVDQSTWIQAGEINFRLKRQGQTLGFADLIISAIAMQNDIPVYTTDNDYQRVPGLKLYQPKNDIP